jgi:hypothetical protein
MSMQPKRTASASLQRDFVIGSAICMGFYVGIAFFAKQVIKAQDLDGPVLAVLAAAPALGFLAYIVVFARYLARIDEYRRHLMVQALLIAVGITLIASSAWDFLQSYGVATAPRPFFFTTSFVLVFSFAQVGVNLADKFGLGAAKAEDRP